MFTLVDSYLYWTPVPVSTPDPTAPGKFTAQTFDVQFEAMSADQVTTFFDERKEQALATTQNDLITKVVKDWKGVVGPEGAEIPFSATSLAAAIKFAWVSNGIYAAYLKSLRGDAQKGN